MINLNFLIAVKLQKGTDLNEDVYHIAVRGIDWIKLNREDSLVLQRTLCEHEVFPKEGGVFQGKI